MLPLCQEEGIGVIPWSPLARGHLARSWEKQSDTLRATNDPYGQSLYEATRDVDEKVVGKVTELAKIRGVSQAQISLAWLFSKPVVTAPIVGTTQLHHLEDAIAALSVKLSDEEIQILEAQYVPHAVTGIGVQSQK